MDWKDYVVVEELPEQYQEAIRVIGLEATLKLCEAFPGVPLYFKSPHRLLLSAKKRYVKKNFDGRNHRKLALTTGLPLAMVYDVLAEAREEDKQGHLFEGP
jgi:Mor family transcriptional regulator